MKAENVREELYREKVLVIHREKDAESVRRKAYACRDGGIAIQEVTWTTPEAAELVREFSKKKVGTIGAGTILTVDEAKKAVDAGAVFLVSPVFTKAVSDWAKKNDVVYIPGAGTAQEIFHAWEEGCRPVKVFPAPDLGGPAYIKHVLGPLPFLELLPTSGLGLNEIRPYLDAGAKAVGLGAGFTHVPEVVESNGAALVPMSAKAVEIAKGRKAPVAVKA